MRVVLALPATSRYRQLAGQAIERTRAVLNGVFNITLGDVVADTDVHGRSIPSC